MTSWNVPALVSERSGSSAPNLLVVEDSATERERLRQWLAEARGFRLRFAPDVASAMRQLALERPDCVLLDQVLPDGSGTDLLAVLRRRWTASQLPVILMTGAGSEEIAVHALTHGAADYLLKQTLTPERLKMAIAHALERAALERRIDEGTTELMRRNRELEEVRHALEANNERLAAMHTERDELYQMVVHDLRTPIGVVVGASRELEELLDAPPARTMLRLIGRAASRLEALVESLGHLLEAERIDLSLQVQSLSRIVRDVVEELARDAADRGVCVRLARDEAVRAPVDGPQIARLVTNLLSNALRHARSQVTIALRADGDRALLEVSDDGPGVPEESRSRLFQVGVRGDRPGSFGLGLAIVRRIAEQHGGTAAFVEGDAPGACARVTLPVTLQST